MRYEFGLRERQLLILELLYTLLFGGQNVIELEASGCPKVIIRKNLDPKRGCNFAATVM